MTSMQLFIYSVRPAQNGVTFELKSPIGQTDPEASLIGDVTKLVILLMLMFTRLVSLFTDLEARSVVTLPVVAVSPLRIPVSEVLARDSAAPVRLSAVPSRESALCVSVTAGARLDMTFARLFEMVVNELSVSEIPGSVPRFRLARVRLRPAVLARTVPPTVLSVFEIVVVLPVTVSDRVDRLLPTSRSPLPRLWSKLTTDITCVLTLPEFADALPMRTLKRLTMVPPRLTAVRRDLSEPLTWAAADVIAFASPLTVVPVEVDAPASVRSFLESVPESEVIEPFVAV